MPAATLISNHDIEALGTRVWSQAIDRLAVIATDDNDLHLLVRFNGRPTVYRYAFATLEDGWEWSRALNNPNEDEQISWGSWLAGSLRDGTILPLAA